MEEDLAWEPEDRVRELEARKPGYYPPWADQPGFVRLRHPTWR